MQSTILRKSLALACLSASQVMAAEPARTLEEIIITAQKVSESVQDVPVSVAVVSASDLQNMNMQDFAETADLTPGVDLTPGLQAAAIRLRGVGPDSFSLGTPQSVSVFVDEVAQSQIGTVFATMMDIDRVELLRGPQGTLYGQNSPGGAYNISTRRPSLEAVEGYLEGSYSLYDSNDKATTDLRGAINIPLIEDTLAWRVAGVYADADGFIDMKNPESSDRISGGKEHQALRSRLLWHVNDSVEVLWTVNYQDLTDYKSTKNYDGQVPGSGGSNPVPPVYNKFEDNVDWGDFRGEIAGEVKDTSLHLFWETDITNIDFIAFYQEFDPASSENVAPHFGGMQVFEIESMFEATTFELRFSDSNDSFDYVAGLYYLDRPFDNTLQLTLSGALVTGGGQQTDETKSAFGNFTFHLSENWDLSLGARYDENETGVDAQINLAGAFTADAKDSASFEHVSWSAKLRWYPDEDTTVYLAVDNAYKQGGFNVLVYGAAPLTGTFPHIEQAVEDNLSYDEETSTAFEFGVKGTAFHDKVRYGAALFYQEFDDHQISHSGPDAALAPLGSLFSTIVSNAEAVETKGIEFDITYLVGDNWDFNFRAAYFDAVADEWSKRFCDNGESDDFSQVYCPLNDEPLNDLPQWNVNGVVGYQQSLRNGWELYSHASWNWQSKPNVTGATDEFEEDKHRVGLSVGIKDANTGLDVRIWGKNLTDTDYNVNPEIALNGDPSQPDAYEGAYYRGREYGLTLAYSF